MRLRRGRGSRRSSRLHAQSLGPILKIGGLVVVAAGLVLLIIFVVWPWIFGDGKTEEVAVETSATSTPAPTPMAKDDYSDDVEEVYTGYNSINDACVYEDEVIFSAGESKDDMSPNLDRLVILDMETGNTTVVENITKSYDNLFEPKISENFIVYLDCKAEYGGAVCGYDREKQEMFVMREYLYGKPKVTISGDYALWLQQTGTGTDRLYLYYLPTKECVEIETFVNTKFFISAPYISDEAFVYAQPLGESELLDQSYATEEVEVCVIKLKDGGDKERILFTPGTFVYEPKIDGDYIVYMDGTGDESSRLLVCKINDDDTVSEPEVIAENVFNYDIGDGFVAYTQDSAVYIYYFEDGSSGQLSTAPALLSDVTGKDVVWYDVTGDISDTEDIIMHIEVP